MAVMTTLCWMAGDRHQFSSKADVATAGTAESFIQTSTSKKNKICTPNECQCIDTHAQWRAWANTFGNWCVKQVEASPQSQYWFIVMQLELLTLVYVRSLRDSNLSLYFATPAALAPWLFLHWTLHVWKHNKRHFIYIFMLTINKYMIFNRYFILNGGHFGFPHIMGVTQQFQLGNFGVFTTKPTILLIFYTYQLY